MKKLNLVAEAFISDLCFSKKLLAMKTTVLILVISVVQAFGASSYSQNTRLTLNMQDVPIAEVLDEIEEQSEFFFLFNQKLVNVEKTVDLNTKNEKISHILDRLFADADINFIVVDRQILLSPKDILRAEKKVSKIKQQPIQVTGTVTDHEGNSLPGVNIIVKGTTWGTITGPDGKFEIEVSDPAAVLIFSYIGYTSQEIAVGSQTTINIVLEAETIGIEEVYVTALGIKREAKSLGYTASKVAGAAIERSAAPNIINALSGKTAGVFITNPNSIEGGSSRITLRGMTSLSGGNSPLIRVCP